MRLLDGTTHIGPDGVHSIGPTETLERVRPFFGHVGITRLANVTGLDRIGIPVWQAIRPLSRGLSVAQGKGVDDDFARASAVMEAIEQHHAEYDAVPCRMDSYDELRRVASVADVHRLPLLIDSLFNDALLIPWCEAFDLRTGAPVWVPYELVHANAVVPRVPGSGCFLTSTNGLASGNTLAEAALHGLCEVIERDANALWRLGDDEDAAGTRIDVPRITAPGPRALLDRFERARIAVVLWDMTSDIDVPAFRCIIVDQGADAELNPARPAYGAGCHPQPAIAMQRALTEAAQSRLAGIAGTRDDMTRAGYRRAGAAPNLEWFATLAAAPARRDDVSASAPTSAQTIEDELTGVLDSIERAGCGPVLAVDLSRDGWPVHVIRVIVPGLEGPSTSPSYRPGMRSRDRAGVRTNR